MKLDELKLQIKSLYHGWAALGASMDDDTAAEIYEGGVRDVIIAYCESKGYEVEGYPFQKRILGETDEHYDEDYFCYERNLKYLDILAETKEDVFELMYFYGKTFWPDQAGTEDEYKKFLIEENKNNPHDIEF